MRALTEKQAFDAMLYFLRQHVEWNIDDVGRLLDVADYGFLDADGDPLTGDTGTWHDWMQCVDKALSEDYSPLPDAVQWREPERPPE
jgi:hypothetical protein